MKSMNDLVVDLLSEREPLIGGRAFAFLLLKMEKIPNKEIPTLGVSFNDKVGKFTLIYNPDYMDSLSTADKLVRLEHELLHCVGEHHLRFAGANTQRDKLILNIGEDCAINQLILKDIPDGVTLKSFTELLKKFGYKGEVEKLKEAEYYVELLKENDPMKGNKIPTGCGFHNVPIERGIPQMAKAMMEQALLEVRKKFGELPAGLEKIVNNLQNSSRISWRQLLSRPA